MPLLGREVLLEVLRSEGVTHLFGNPGSTELPLMDALVGADDLHYVLALQEATAVGMADGYAQFSGRPAFLNLHTSAGLGNAIGNLTNARANGTPLVVTAGQQDERHLVDDPLLSGDLVALARPVTKWAHEVRTPDELGTVLRRAFNDAMAPPTGPVFVAVRMDHLEREVSTPVPARSAVDRRPIAGGLDTLAAMLIGTSPGRVALVVGDEVARSDAIGAVVELAEKLGATVFGSPLYGSSVFPPTHPQWAGMLPPSAARVRAALDGFDRVLLLGGQAFLVYPYSAGSPVPDHVDLLHLSPDPSQIGRAHPVRFGAAGDIGATLEALNATLGDLRPPEPATEEAAARSAAASVKRSAEIEMLDTSARARYGPAPMHPMAAAHALLRAIPPDVAVVDEAITTGVYVRGFHHTDVSSSYFFCRGGGLGWGMPAACGIALASRRPVLCVVGDGSAMYSPQALWTAAHERLPVVFAVVDNGQYLILKQNLRGMGGASARTERFVAMDLDQPRVDFCALAEAMGVPATRIDRTEDIATGVAQALASGWPALLHIPITTR
ncbi:MAG: thiamine pyrophosphate-binding protein [Actinomycetota bacterium]|nr:thiamine pyrophosphate-binding protein [Actinomycetota bacterium]